MTSESQKKPKKSRSVGRPKNVEEKSKKVEVKSAKRGRPRKNLTQNSNEPSAKKNQVKRVKAKSSVALVKKKSRSNVETKQMSLLVGGAKIGPGHSETAVVAYTSIHNNRKGVELPGRKKDNTLCTKTKPDRNCTIGSLKRPQPKSVKKDRVVSRSDKKKLPNLSKKCEKSCGDAASAVEVKKSVVVKKLKSDGCKSIKKLEAKCVGRSASKKKNSDGGGKDTAKRGRKLKAENSTDSRSKVDSSLTYGKGRYNQTENVTNKSKSDKVNHSSNALLLAEKAGVGNSSSQTDVFAARVSVGKKQANVCSPTKCKSSTHANTRLKKIGMSGQRPRGRRRVASLNALAMVHVMYESDAMRNSDETSHSSVSSDSDNGKGAKSSSGLPSVTTSESKVYRSKKRKRNTSESEDIIDARFVKRVASLNAQAIMAASCNPPKKRQRRVKSNDPDLIDDNNNSDKGSSHSQKRLSGDFICRASSKEDNSKDIVLSKSSSDSKSESNKVYSSPPPPYQAIDEEGEYRMSQSQSKSSNFSQKLESTRNDDFRSLSNQRIASLQNQSTVTAQNFDNVSNITSGPILQYGNQYHSNGQPYSQQHSSVQFAHNFFQPTGPLLQAVSDHFNLIHKPVPYHPHQFSDLSHSISANHRQTFLPPESCHSMTPMHSLQSLIPEKCQSIHHVPGSPPYNQMPGELPSMPSLQPLHSAQQPLTINKADNFSYPPPPSLMTQHQFNRCQTFSGAYQPAVLTDFSTSSQPIQNFGNPIQPSSMNLSKSFVSINQPCTITKQEHSSSDNNIIKSFSYGSQQKLLGSEKAEAKKGDIKKTTYKKILPNPISKCSKPYERSEFVKCNKAKTRPTSCSEIKNYVETVKQLCMRNENSIKDNTKVCAPKVGSLSNNKSNSVSVANAKRESYDNTQSKAQKQVKVKKIQKQEKEEKFTNNKKKCISSVKTSDPKLKKQDSNKNNDKLSSRISVCKETSNAKNAKKMKAKKLCAGWNWSGTGKKKLVYLNNEDGGVMRLCYPAIQHHEGDIIRERDSVLICSGVRKTDIPYIAKISALWENPEDGEMMMSLLWYYRPEQTEHGRKPHHIDQEIFASKHKDYNSVACIEDKCFVITYGEFCRYKAEVRRQDIGYKKRIDVVPSPLNGYVRSHNLPSSRVSPDRTFVCRKVYDYRQKRCLKNPS